MKLDTSPPHLLNTVKLKLKYFIVKTLFLLLPNLIADAGAGNLQNVLTEHRIKTMKTRHPTIYLILISNTIPVVLFRLLK